MEWKFLQNLKVTKETVIHQERSYSRNVDGFQSPLLLDQLNNYKVNKNR